MDRHEITWWPVRENAIRDPIKVHWAFLIFLLLAAVLFLSHIGTYQHFIRAESNFTLGARMALDSGAVLLPHAPHELPLNKPPLQYWLIELSFSLFGVNFGASRIPSALSALAVLLSLYLFSLRFGGIKVGLLASTILATSYIFVSFSRLSMNDMLLTLCVTAALLSWITVLADKSKPRPIMVVLGYVAVALGFLTKGPIALVMILLPVALDVMIQRDWSQAKRLKPLLGSVVIVLVGAPYFVLVYLYHGLEPLTNFFVNENLRRYTGTSYGISKSKAFLYEPRAYFANFAPWSPLMLTLGWLPVRWRTLPEADRHIARLLLLWIAVPILFFTFSRFKLDYYFIPAMPPAALLIAFQIVHAPAISRRMRMYGTIGALLLLAILAIFAGLIVESNFSEAPWRWLPHVVASGTLATAAFLFVRYGAISGLLALGFSIWAVAISVYLVLLPVYARLQPVEKLLSKIPPNAHVYVSSSAGDWSFDLGLYLPVEQAAKVVSSRIDDERIGAVLREDPAAVVLIYEQDFLELRQTFELTVIEEVKTRRYDKLVLKQLLRPAYERLYLVTGHHKAA